MNVSSHGVFHDLCLLFGVGSLELWRLVAVLGLATLVGSVGVAAVGVAAAVWNSVFDVTPPCPCWFARSVLHVFIVRVFLWVGRGSVGDGESQSIGRSPDLIDLCGLYFRSGKTRLKFIASDD